MVILAFDPGTVHFGYALFAYGSFIDHGVIEGAEMTTEKRKKYFSQVIGDMIQDCLDLFEDDDFVVVYESARRGAWDENIVIEQSKKFGIKVFAYLPSDIRKTVYADLRCLRNRKRKIEAKYSFHPKDSHSFDACMAALYHYLTA